MSFNQIDINRFGGLNVNADPTLIQDYEGSDIVNFRMEKLGKLVSRNGNLPGATGFHGDPDAHPNNFLVSNEGVTGIGELILETKWDDFDTDRFMVYFVRGEELHGDGVRQKAGFIFAPLTGSLRNVLLSIETTPPVNDGVGIFDLVEQVEPLGVIGSRELAASEQVNAQSLEQLFIDEFVRMNQYNRRLVISDRINGDMRITDSFDRAEDPTHALKLKENTLYNFDVDVIKFDYQLEADQKNESVENGMALYRYILPKNTTKISDDKFTLTIGDSAWLGSNWADTRQKVHRHFSASGGTLNELQESMFNFAIFRKDSAEDDTYPHLWQSWNTHVEYRFTTENQASEYDDVMGAIELNKDKYEDEDGNLQEELAADVYVWDELKFDYKPCSGTDDGESFLRDIDRFWTKQTPGIPRITKLNKKVGHGREVPLGTWRYRFVWDFGSGEYSAPTTEVLVQDALFSVLSDGVVSSDNNSIYERPFLFDASEALNASVSNITFTDTAQNTYGSATTHFPAIWTNPADNFSGPANSLTNTGISLWKVKNALYDVSHRFGGAFPTMTDLESHTDASVYNIARKYEGEFAVLGTIFFSRSSVTLSGFASQFCDISSEGMTVGINKIVVPVFQSFGVEATYNSVFDDEGRYRGVYCEDANSNGRSLVWEGRCDAFGALYNSGADLKSKSTTSTLPPGDLLGFVPITKDAYLNFFSREDLDDYPPNSLHFMNLTLGNDGNNCPDPGYVDPITYPRSRKRPNTIIRAIKNENEKLTAFINPAVPTEARRRLLLEGVAGVDLINSGDEYGVNIAHLHVTGTPDTVALGTNLDYDVRRWYKFFSNQVILDPVNIKYTNGQRGNIDETATSPNYIFDDISYRASNLDITIYGEAQRLIALEQLSSYFPASLLFDAPRVRIHIDKEAVPTDAKRLLVFRTVSSNRNEFDPQNFGLVDTVEILRAEGGEQLSTIYDSGATAVAGEPIFKREEILDDGAEAGEYVRGFSYFDKVRDQNIDYNSSPNDYEGKRDPIKSAFNVPLNERMYYANYLETIVPPAPRGQIKDYEAP